MARFTRNFLVTGSIMLTASGCGSGEEPLSGAGRLAGHEAARKSPIGQPADFRPDAGGWTRVGNEGQWLDAGSAVLVRYGARGSYVYKVVSGRFRASNAFFGVDPAVGVAKHVDRLDPKRAASPTVAQAPGHMPQASAATLPKASPAVAVDQVRFTGEMPVASDIGAFRTVCGFSHMASDDPIVHPGQPGKAHLHAFFGNTGVNANSTADSIASTGNSTCRGGTVNRTAYWVPAMIDTRNGRPVAPALANIYYKQGYHGIAAADLQELPPGLRMIAGDPMKSEPAGAMRFKCVGGREDLSGPGIQNCPVGAELWSEIVFPQCWDGINLDSADHKSHMAYPERGRCPASHPIALPEISYNIVYPVLETDAPSRWRLSSDMYDPGLPGGYSSHGDWFNGWKPDVMRAWVEHCNRAQRDCRSHLLGDGRVMH